ncbi:hypothetical protein VTI74DRAFT_1173 [Chaetomium olivicolor]
MDWKPSHDRDDSRYRRRSPRRAAGRKDGVFHQRRPHHSPLAQGRRAPGDSKSDLDNFFDYARTMDFNDKDGNNLLLWRTLEAVFEAWTKASAGRSCDYTGLSYERLTGGSCIQWLCNEQNPAEMPSGDITEEQVFIPFHFGYWDSQDGRVRAGNELTIVYSQTAGTLSPNNPYSNPAPSASRNPPPTTHTTFSSSNLTRAHERQLELWLGETYQATLQFLSLYTHLIPTLIYDLAVEASLRVLHRIASEMHSALGPFVSKYGENKQRGRHRAQVLREALFPGSSRR